MLNKFRVSAWPRWLRDFVPLALWMGLIFFLSSQSVLIDIDNQVGDKTFYKSAHFFAYAVLMWLMWRALSPGRRAGWPVLLAALALTVLYGVSDEVHQLFVPGRHGRLADVLFDSAGALAMTLLLRRFHRFRAFPESAPVLIERRVLPRTHQKMRSREEASRNKE